MKYYHYHHHHHRININTITIFSDLYCEILSLGTLSTNGVCKVSAMTEGNIPSIDRKKQLMYLLLGYVKNSPKIN